MGRTPVGGGPAFRFIPSEVADMEKALDASKGATPARTIVEELAIKFSNSPERAGQKPVQSKQVWNWFQNRRHAQKAKSAKTPEKHKAIATGSEPPSSVKVLAPAPAPAPASSPGNFLTPLSIYGAGILSVVVRKLSEPKQLDFEAKSARDEAWYDVATFISKRTGENGEPEVRVRFAGFGSEEDEWVSVKNAVRQRSLPCETTECVAVLPGDLILCFQEGNEQALYFDAHILDVQRRRHDVRGCRCRFWVRYRHDQTEEVVPLRKVCRRPETESRLQQAHEAAALASKNSSKIHKAVPEATGKVQSISTSTNSGKGLGPPPPVFPSKGTSPPMSSPNAELSSTGNLGAPAVDLQGAKEANSLAVEHFAGKSTAQALDLPDQSKAITSTLQHPGSEAVFTSASTSTTVVLDLRPSGHVDIETPIHT